MQIALNFEAGRVEAFRTCREFVAARAHQQGRTQASIAADMDYAPSQLTRKLAQAPGDSARFTLDDLEAYIDVTDDTSPVEYLVEKYLGGGEAGRIQQLEAELARLRGDRAA